MKNPYRRIKSYVSSMFLARISNVNVSSYQPRIASFRDSLLLRNLYNQLFLIFNSTLLTYCIKPIKMGQRLSVCAKTTKNVVVDIVLSGADSVTDILAIHDLAK